MSDLIRWGILGAARIARDWVCPGIHASARGRIAGIASRDPARAAAMAAPYHDVRIFDSYQALLDAPGIDAVYIPLPNHLHVEWTERCLRAGKHVLCEKPIALKAGEIDRLIAARDETGCMAAEAFMVTHHPQWHRVRTLLAEGAIGRLCHVQGSFTYNNPDPDNIRNRPETGGGALYDIGVYPCVTTRFVTGQEPLSVTARIMRENGVDTTSRVWAEFDGFALEFYVSMRMGLRQSMLFHGTEGWLELAAPFNPPAYGDQLLSLRRADGTVIRERFGRVDQYRLQADAFHATILDGAPYDCPLEFSRGNQVMIDMIHAAG